MGGSDIGRSRTKWWGTDRHIVIYYTDHDSQRDLLRHQRAGAGRMADARSRGRPKATCNELRAAYEGFHQDVRAVLEACPDCHKWAILEREPLPRWSDGRVVLLGDACASDDALHGAGRRHLDRGRGGAGALPRGGRWRRRRGRVQALRGAPQAAHLAYSGDLQRQHLDEARATATPVWLYGYDALERAARRAGGAPASRGGVTLLLFDRLEGQLGVAGVDEAVFCVGALAFG